MHRLPHDRDVDRHSAEQVDLTPDWHEGLSEVISSSHLEWKVKYLISFDRQIKL